VGEGEREREHEIERDIEELAYMIVVVWRLGKSKYCSLESKICLASQFMGN
jgi:hypothetical protein